MCVLLPSPKKNKTTNHPNLKTMSTKKKSYHQLKEEKADENVRARVTNWDRLPVRIRRSNNQHRTIARKVVCRGIERVDIGELNYNDIVKKLRCGFEVRITIAGKDAIRFYPCLDKKLKKIFLCAATMGPFRESIYRGKNVQLFHCGEEVDKDYGEDLASEATVRNSNWRDNVIEVTSDTIVECPNCQTPIRVGQLLRK